jgi:hypothetical protein
MEETIIDNPVTIADITLIPVGRVTRSYWHSNKGVSFMGVKQPVAVIVVSPSVKKAFRITGEEVPLGQLIQEVPGVEEIMAGT